MFIDYRLGSVVYSCVLAYVFISYPHNINTNIVNNDYKMPVGKEGQRKVEHSHRPL